ncbi:hypothetical protein HCY66_06360 [Acinetobacter radioresistens]|uniref:hypothetical protein n=1 Tax=Acinetobacter radioresistens TaxID=40216 RepID=UPI0020034B10|nr:hypothetical protein [Acinetobacter radioresistens]MCK4089708.1 hypothetical protein [Acinetobacter radioresistens]
MINLIYKPFAYLNIKLSDGSSQKKQLDLLLPLAISIFMALLLGFLQFIDSEINIFSSKINILPPIISFFQSMPGFYIAALAAIATFPSESMNKEMKTPTPYLLIDSEVEDVPSNRDRLSRRRFLCYMFAYLAFISILFFFIAIGLNFINSIYIFNIPNYLLDIGYMISCLIIFFVVTQTVLITFLGLWYLGHRIHFNDNE